MVGVFEKRKTSSFEWLFQTAEPCSDQAAVGRAFSEDIFDNLSPLTRIMYISLSSDNAICDPLNEEDFYLNPELPSALSRLLMRIFRQSNALLSLDEKAPLYINLRDYLTATYEAILHCKQIIPGSPECRIIRALLDGGKQTSLLSGGPAYIANERWGHVVFLKDVSVIPDEEDGEIMLFFNEVFLGKGANFTPAFAKLLAAIHKAYEIGIKTQTLYSCGSYSKSIGEGEAEIIGIIKAVHRFIPEALATSGSITAFDFDEYVLRFRDKHILLGV